MVYLISFIIPGILWLISIAISGIFPFGRDIIFTSDMAYQYAGYFEYVQNIITNGTNMFFSFYKGMGEETLGMLSYYMMSPFNLILGLFPKENITEAVLVINLLKICACGLTFSIFLKNKFKSNNKIAIVAFSCCYALMAYNIAYQFNIMWLDGVVWLPLVILGIERIIKSNKSELFFCSLAIAIISNWYIGFMICVFSALYVFYRLICCNDVDLTKRVLKKFILFGVLAAGTGLVVIVPAIYTCLSELERSTLVNEGVINYTLIDILSKFVIGGFNFYQITDENISADYLNLPNLFAGTSVLFFFTLYFFNKSVDKDEKKVDGIFGIILLAMTVIMPLNKIWHVFTYNVWFPYRYSFCLTFYMIHIAYKSFLTIKNMELKSIFKILLIIIGIYFIIEKLSYEYIMSELIYCTIFMLIAGYIAIRLMKNNEKNSYLLLALVMCTEMFVNTATYMQSFEYGDRDEFYQERFKVEKYLSDINGYYRIENNVTKDYNSSLGLEYMGITSSSTMGNESSRGLLEALGYIRTVNNCVEYKPTTKFADNFLGIKYNITDKVTENKDALSIGFLVKDDVLKIKEFITKWGSYSNSFEKQNELIKNATNVKEDLYQPISIAGIKLENLEKVAEKKNTYIKTYKGQKSLYSFEFKVPNENEIYLKINGNILDKAKIYINQKEFSEYMTSDSYSVINIGKFKNGDKVNVDIEFIEAKDEIIINDIWLYYEDIEVYELIMEELKANQFNIENMTSSEINGSITVNKDNQLLLFTVPYDRNLKVYVDGSETESICALDSLISIQMPKGTHLVKISYQPDYFIGIVPASLSCLILAIVSIIVEYKKKKVTVENIEEKESGE